MKGCAGDIEARRAMGQKRATATDVKAALREHAVRLPANLTRWHLAEAAADVTMKECLADARGHEGLAKALKGEAARIAKAPPALPEDMRDVDEVDVLTALNPVGSDAHADRLAVIRHTAGCTMAEVVKGFDALAARLVEAAILLARDPEEYGAPSVPLTMLDGERAMRLLRELATTAARRIAAVNTVEVGHVTPASLGRLLNSMQASEPAAWVSVVQGKLKGLSPLDAHSVARSVGQGMADRVRGVA